MKGPAKGLAFKLLSDGDGSVSAAYGADLKIPLLAGTATFNPFKQRSTHSPNAVTRGLSSTTFHDVLEINDIP